MTGRLRIAVAAAVATALTTTGLMRLLAASTWIWPVLGAIVVTAVAGELARRLIRPRPLVIAVQVVLVFWYDVMVLAHEAAWGGFTPGPGALRMIGDLFSQGGTDMGNTVPGAASTPGMTAILVVSLGALAILVDALAATYAVAPLAGLPLLALYLVPATRLGGGNDWLAFTVTAAGYTALLSAEGRERLSRWGRPLVHTGSRRQLTTTSEENGANAPRQSRVDTGPIAATGHQITMIALCAAVLAPVLLPTVTSGLFGLGPSGGEGTGGHGGGTLKVRLSQALDLKPNLTGVNSPIFTYTADDKKGHYIRLSTLDNWDGASWSAAPANQALAANGDLGAKPLGLDATGLSAAQYKAQYPAYSMTINLQAQLGTETDGGFGHSIYTLPVPYPATHIDVPKNNTWLVNPKTDEIASSQDYSGSLSQYTVSAVEPNPSRTLLDKVPTMTPDLAAKDGVGDVYTSPANLSPLVKTTADKVVGTETRPFEQAEKLMDYFAHNGGFSYNVNAPVYPGDAERTMEALIAGPTKSGYCQTFAETMAAMARYLGIPARVALGFTDGVAATGSTQYTVKTHDFHAWPELYFDGIGWLRFEPTVGITGSAGGGNGNVPAYATPAKTATPSTTPSSTNSGGAFPGATASTNCPAQVRRAGGCSDSDPKGGITVPQKFGSLGWFGAVPRFLDYWLLGGSPGAIVLRFVLLAALLVASVPMFVRILRRRRRGRIASGRVDGRDLLAPEPSDEGLEWEAEGGSRRSRTEDTSGDRVRILAAWAEVRDSATDLGYAWPSSETPRQSAERLITKARFSSRAQDAMDRLTGLAERANYARTLRSTLSADAGSGSAGSVGPAETMAKLFDDVRTIRGGLAEPVGRRTRLRATMLPPSAMASLRERREDFTGRVYERMQMVGTRLTRRLRRAGS